MPNTKKIAIQMISKYIWLKTIWKALELKYYIFL